MSALDSRIEKIARECEEAGASKWVVAKLVKELHSVEAESIEELRRKTIEILRKLDPKAATAYESFYRMRVLNSRLRIEQFDKGSIINSLLKETKISRNIAEQISYDVENRLKDTGIEIVQASMIRELVNAKLIEFGKPQIRNAYARVGMPVFDVKQKLLNGEEITNEQLLLEFTISQLPFELLLPYFKNEIFVADLAGFLVRDYAEVITIDTNSNSAKELVVELIKKALSRKTFLKTTLPINLLIAQHMYSRNDAADAIKLIDILLNFASTSIAFYTPQIFERRINRQAANKIANKILAEYNLPILVDNAFKLKLIEKKNLSTERIFLNCADYDYNLFGNGFYSHKNLITSLFALNLAKLVSEQSPIKKIKELLKNCEKLFRFKQKNAYYKLKKGCVGIAFYGIDKLAEEMQTTKKGLFSKLKRLLPNGFICVALPMDAAKRFSNRDAKLQNILHEVDSVEKLAEAINNKHELIRYIPR
ncbi:MAG: hypothetical protein J7L14_00415 [Candidatus Diapherotrites archaeon]|nr:hypothetical protein [Candidatus Diapherotrites archaeon]